MAEFRVTASKIREQAGQLRQLNASLSTQITVLEGNERNVCSMWEGEAKTAFHTAFDHDKAQMQNFKQAIDKYVDALEQIAASYEKAEAANITTATTRKYH